MSVRSALFARSVVSDDTNEPTPAPSAVHCNNVASLCTSVVSDDDLVDHCCIVQCNLSHTVISVASVNKQFPSAVSSCHDGAKVS